MLPQFSKVSNVHQIHFRPFILLVILLTVTVIQPCNYQVSKSIVNKIEFDDNSCHLNINNLPYSARYFITDWQFAMFKRGNPMDMILVSVHFKIGFLNFSNICCWFTLELPHRGNSNVHLQHYVHSINECFNHKTGFTQATQLLFYVSV